MQPLAGLWVCDGCPGSPPTPPPGPGVPVPPQLVTPGDSACPLPCRALEAARCWGGCCGAPQQAPSEPCPQGHQLVSEGTNPGDRGWPEHHGLAGGCPEGSLQVLGLRWGHTEPPALLGHHAGTSSRTHGHHGHPPPPRNTSSGAAISMATSSGDTALPQPPAPGTPHHGHGLQGHQLQAPLFRVHTIWGPAAQVHPQALGFWGLPAPWKGRRQLTALGSQLHFGLQQRPEGQRGARVSGSPPGCHPAARLGLVPCPTWSSCHRTRTIKIGRDLHDPLVQPSPTTVTH